MHRAFVCMQRHARLQSRKVLKNHTPPPSHNVISIAHQHQPPARNDGSHLPIAPCYRPAIIVDAKPARTHGLPAHLSRLPAWARRRSRTSSTLHQDASGGHLHLDISWSRDSSRMRQGSRLIWAVHDKKVGNVGLAGGLNSKVK